MKKPSFALLVRYLGVAAAILVPALVVAQSLPSAQSFQAGQVLRANDVLLLRDALENALARIAQLEATAVVKSSIYNVVGTSTATLSTGQRANATAACDAGDVAIACSCGGAAGGVGAVDMDTRSFLLRNPPAAASTCDCNGEWLGAGTAQVSTQVTCLDVPPLR